jgi:hypothetical protein
MLVLTCGLLLLSCEADQSVKPPLTPMPQIVPDDTGPKDPLIKRDYESLSYPPPYNTVVMLETSWFDGQLSYILTATPYPRSHIGRFDVQLRDQQGFDVHQFPVYGTQLIETSDGKQRFGQARGIIKLPWKQMARVCCWSATIGPAVDVLR